jgi:hypothetical protein
MASPTLHINIPITPITHIFFIFFDHLPTFLGTYKAPLPGASPSFFAFSPVRESHPVQASFVFFLLCIFALRSVKCCELFQL